MIPMQRARSRERKQGLLSAFLGLKLRIPRLLYWMGLAPTVAALTYATPLIQTAHQSGNQDLGVIGAVTAMSLFWTWICLIVNRAHDFDVSGWVIGGVLIALVTIATLMTSVTSPLPALVNLSFFIVLGLIPGTPGPNTYGAKPGGPLTMTGRDFPAF